MNWFEKESNSFSLSMIALAGAIAAVKFNALLIFGQPCDWRISFWLFIFCVFFRIKYHFIEPRLRQLYVYQRKKSKDYQKSIEQFRDELYLYSGYLLCLSIIHFYIFLIVFLIHLSIDQWYNFVYFYYQKQYSKDQRERYKVWYDQKFNPNKLFASWIGMNFFGIALTLAAIFYLINFNSTSNLNKTVCIFIPLVFFTEILLDWFLLNRKFYFNYFRE